MEIGFFPSIIIFSIICNDVVHVCALGAEPQGCLLPKKIPNKQTTKKRHINAFQYNLENGETEAQCSLSPLSPGEEMRHFVQAGLPRLILAKINTAAWLPVDMCNVSTQSDATQHCAAQVPLQPYGKKKKKKSK